MALLQDRKVTLPLLLGVGSDPLREFALMYLSVFNRSCMRRRLLSQPPRTNQKADALRSLKHEKSHSEKIFIWGKKVTFTFVMAVRYFRVFPAQ